MTQFSIIVPVYNAARYLHRCLEGLLRQTARDYEILIVDNNSSDGSDRIAAGYDRVRLLREPEQGSYAARNLGLRCAAGRIAVFTDPDCVPEPDWLEQMGRALADPAAALVLGGRRFASDGGMLGMLSSFESATVAYAFEHRRLGAVYAYTNNLAIPAARVREAGGFQHVERGGDTLLLREVARRWGAASIRYAPGARVRHLEIATARDYLRKKRVYGKVNAEPDRGAEALPWSVRAGLALAAARTTRGSAADRIAFWGVLAAGAIQFEWERRRAAPARA